MHCTQARVTKYESINLGEQLHSFARQRNRVWYKKAKQSSMKYHDLDSLGHWSSSPQSSNPRERQRICEKHLEIRNKKNKNKARNEELLAVMSSMPEGDKFWRRRIGISIPQLDPLEESPHRSTTSDLCLHECRGAPSLFLGKSADMRHPRGILELSGGQAIRAILLMKLAHNF